MPRIESIFICRPLGICHAGKFISPASNVLSGGEVLQRGYFAEKTSSTGHGNDYSPSFAGCHSFAMTQGLCRRVLHILSRCTAGDVENNSDTPRDRFQGKLLPCLTHSRCFLVTLRHDQRITCGLHVDAWTDKEHVRAHRSTGFSCLAN